MNATDLKTFVYQKVISGLKPATGMCGEGRQEKASEGKVKEGAAVIGHHENTADVALHLG